jgi:hypothetical protein
MHFGNHCPMCTRCSIQTFYLPCQSPWLITPGAKMCEMNPSIGVIFVERVSNQISRDGGSWEDSQTYDRSALKVAWSPSQHSSRTSSPSLERLHAVEKTPAGLRLAVGGWWRPNAVGRDSSVQGVAAWGRGPCVSFRGIYGSTLRVVRLVVLVEKRILLCRFGFRDCSCTVRTIGTCRTVTSFWGSNAGSIRSESPRLRDAPEPLRD